MCRGSLKMVRLSLATTTMCRARHQNPLAIVAIRQDYRLESEHLAWDRSGLRIFESVGETHLACP